MVACPSNVVMRKTAVDGTLVCDSLNNFKAFAVIEASQLYHYFLCQAILTRLYTKKDLHSNFAKKRFELHRNQLRSFEHPVNQNFRESGYNVKWRVLTLRAHKHLMLIALMFFERTATLCLKR